MNSSARILPASCSPGAFPTTCKIMGSPPWTASKHSPLRAPSPAHPGGMGAKITRTPKTLVHGTCPRGSELELDEVARGLTREVRHEHVGLPAVRPQICRRDAGLFPGDLPVGVVFLLEWHHQVGRVNLAPSVNLDRLTSPSCRDLLGATEVHEGALDLVFEELP